MRSSASRSLEALLSDEHQHVLGFELRAAQLELLTAFAERLQHLHFSLAQAGHVREARGCAGICGGSSGVGSGGRCGGFGVFAFGGHGFSDIFRHRDGFQAEHGGDSDHRSWDQGARAPVVSALEANALAGRASEPSAYSADVSAGAQPPCAEAKAIGGGARVVDARLQIAARFLRGGAEIAHGGVGGLRRVYQFGGGGADAVLAGAQRGELAI